METNSTLLHQLISAQAQRSPEALALVEEGTNASRSLSYAELEQQSDALAGYLQSCGCRPNSIVGIFMETSIDYVVAMLAALKAGAAYMPLDLAHPELLLTKIIAQTEICVILTHKQWLPRLKAFSLVFALDDATAWQHHSYRKELLAGIGLDNYAYVVFSSGSSGEPKGIIAPHRGALHSYFERFSYFAVQPGDRVACNVFFVWEVLRPLLVGATSYIVPDSLIYDPRQLLAYLRRWQITEILFTPSLLEKILQIRQTEKNLFDQAFARVKAIWLNGEVLTRSLGRTILQTFTQEGLQIFNLYSISECHDVSVTELHCMHRANSDICSVGKAMPGVTLHIFRYGQTLECSDAIGPSKHSFDPELLLPCPPGEPRSSLTQGEIYVGGPTLALGYLNKPELTAERFIYWKPNSESRPVRLYRTGDLGRFLLPEDSSIKEDAFEIEVDGRCDFMVKLRGYSVHLGMIEAALCAYPGVLHAAALPHGEEGGEKRLLAYVVRDRAANWQIQDGLCPELLNFLKQSLPHYMLPQIFIELESIPLEPVSGKADHKKLPPPPDVPTFIVLDDLCEAYRSSRMELASIVEQLWSRILHLNISKPMQESTFFDLGGHSLLAAELASAFEQVFGRQISVRQIYLYPTIADQLRYLDSVEEELDNAQIVARMQSDAILDGKTAALLHGKKIEPVSLSEARNIFVTGATGFLGAFVLAELLAHAPNLCQFHCLVRSADEQAGLKRIFDNLSYYHLHRKEWEPMITAYSGDLSQENFGLNQADYAKLLKLDLIFHCGSLVNYLYPYEVIREATVGGAQAIFALAARAGTAVHFISTNGIYASAEARPHFGEDRNIEHYAEFLDNGYGQGKWVAEKIAWEAIDAGLPVCIYRPGNLGHSSRTGRYNPNDFQTLIIQAALRLRCAPLRPEWGFEFTPVDFLASCLLNFAKQAEQYGAVFNFVEPQVQDTVPLFERMKREGLIERLLPYREWLELLRREARGDKSLLVLSEGLDDVELWLDDSSIYDDRNLRSQVERPRVDLAYYWQLVEALKASLQG